MWAHEKSADSLAEAREALRQEGEELRRRAALTAEAREHKERGNLAFKKGAHAAAIEAYTAAIALDGTDHVFWANRSACHLQLQQWEQAIADAQEAIQLDDTFLKAHYRLVEGLLGSNQQEQARESAARACTVAQGSRKKKDPLRKQIEELSASLEQAQQNNNTV
eukprot:TRINITY_DN38885_c0_g1_i1.p1 TRINITY_DN38885_c0_g1~~TRINITY_DN38885_c0_g1_i1.p1  ORF type:complete len:165 (-),score=56.22 TRINITY_DN38885_c0_g1_i1:77-571(-)